MKKNVAGQMVGAQLINATTGAAFTAAVTVSVTGDAGTQATGSVGAGACTHEGNGYHTYAPAQAETNYDLVAFTFTGTGAIPVTVQIYTGFPQAGDSFARVGAPAGASVSADIAAVKAETAIILADTNDIQTRLPAVLVGGRIDANVGAISSSATAADNLESGALGLVPSTCAAGSTTTSIVTNLTEATNDHYNGRVITFTGGALLGQSTSISGYNGTTKTLTVVALTEAPASTDGFVIS